MPRALIVKFGAIGDVLMVLPAARLLHERGYEVDWVCGRQVLPLLALYPWVNPIVADDRAILAGSKLAKLRALAALWRTVAGRRYDLIATLYYDPRYRLVALPLRARRLVMLSSTDRAARILPGRHHSDEFARILLALPDEVRPTQLAPVPPDRLPEVALPATGDAPRIVLCPAGARNLLAEAVLRRWPVEGYVALARILLDRGCQVVLVGGPDDSWVRPHFAALAGTSLVDRIGALSLPEALAVMDASAAVVTHDTGPLHLAGVSRAAVVALFGPTDPHVFAPQRAGVTAIWGGEGFACRPCYDGHSFAPCPANDCMRQIDVEEVLGELDRLLAAPAPPSRRILVPSQLVPAAAIASVASSRSEAQAPRSSP